MRRQAPASDQARQLGLGSRRKDMAYAPEQVIRDMGPDAVPFLLQVIEEQRADSARRKWGLAYFAILLVVLYLIGTALFIHWFNHTFSGFLLRGVFHLGVLGFLFRGGIGTTSFLQRRATELLTELADKRALGGLVELIDSTTGESAKALYRTLTRLFKQVQASDAALLNQKQRALLVEALLTSPPTGREGSECTIQALRALRQIGDGSFIEPVQKLADRIAVRPEDRLIHEAAIECLPYLYVFAEREAKSGTLVRAAVAPDGDPARSVLLRPAAGTHPPEEAARLVRSVEETE